MIALIIIVVLGLFFTVMAFWRERYVEKLLHLSLSVVCWLAAAAKSVLTSYPYAFLYENALDNSYTVVSGTYTVLEQGLPWLFLAIAVMMVAYGFYYLSKEVFGGSHE